MHADHLTRRSNISLPTKGGGLLYRDAGEDAELVLGDFGLAQLVADGDEERAARGTLAYMAPEQRRGEMTPSSDVYASAVVLFEMFTGHTPWSREVLMAGTRRTDDFALPRDLFDSAPHIADAVQAHIIKLGDPDPSKRPTTAQALAESQRLRERIIAAGAA